MKFYVFVANDSKSVYDFSDKTEALKSYYAKCSQFVGTGALVMLIDSNGFVVHSEKFEVESNE